MRLNYVEYGIENNDIILLLHGGGLSWWNYEEAARLLQKHYHVILPILDGHAASDKAFTTIEDNAAEIISFVDEQFGGHGMLREKKLVASEKCLRFNVPPLSGLYLIRKKIIADI